MGATLSGCAELRAGAGRRPHFTFFFHFSCYITICFNLMNVLVPLQVREDVTRYRYGDEQHLDEALTRIFR